MHASSVIFSFAPFLCIMTVKWLTRSFRRQNIKVWILLTLASILFVLVRESTKWGCECTDQLPGENCDQFRKQKEYIAMDMSNHSTGTTMIRSSAIRHKPIDTHIYRSGVIPHNGPSLYDKSVTQPIKYYGSDSDLATRLSKSLGAYIESVEKSRTEMLYRWREWVDERIQVWPMMTVSEWDSTFFRDLRKNRDSATVIGYSSPSKPVPYQLINNPSVLMQRDKYFVWSLDEFSCGRLSSLYKGHHLFRGICEEGHNYFGLGLKGLTTSSKDRIHTQELYEYIQYQSRLYLTILPNAYIEGSNYGYVYTSDVILLPLACAEGWTPKPHEMFYNLSSSMVGWPLYDEVFVTAQHWGSMYYHWTVDQLPKIVTHLEFLKNNARIYILVNAEDDMLEHVGYRHFKMLGLDPNRIIRGNVRARVAYIPQGGGCVETFNPFAVQYMSNIFLDIISSNLEPSQAKRTILLIHRTSKRWLEQHNDIAALLERIAHERGLDLDVFTDNPGPSLEDTQLLFHRAVVVVGPHGAGFANVIYARPGTAVLEVLCGPPDTTQYCYPFLSYSLGLRHHGIGAVYGGCKGLIIHLAYLEAMVYMYLDELDIEKDTKQ